MAAVGRNAPFRRPIRAVAAVARYGCVFTVPIFADSQEELDRLPGLLRCVTEGPKQEFPVIDKFTGNVPFDVIPLSR